MNRVENVSLIAVVVTIATVLCAGRASALDDYRNRAGYNYNYNNRYQPSQSYYPSQQRQYAPAQPGYRQSYNQNSGDPYRQQSDYGRPSAYGSGFQQPYGSPQSQGYLQQQYGGGRATDTAAAGDASGNDGNQRRPHRRRWMTRDRSPNGPAGAAAYPRAAAPGRSAWGSDQRGTFGRSVFPQAAAVSPQQGGGSYAYGQVAACVRKCDGYFFPMGLVGDQTSIEGHRSLCTAMCPDAKTELYFMPQGGDGIGTAVNAMGSPYSKMPRALRYTKARDAACSCHGSGSQARLVSLMKDFTMRRGDAVMTVNGVLVFNGAWRWPYSLADFQVLDKAKYYLSNARALASLEKASLGVQAAIRRPRKGEERTLAAAAAGPFTFITDNNGKSIRLVGDALSYAPTTPVPIDPMLPAAATAPASGDSDPEAVIPALSVPR